MDDYNENTRGSNTTLQTEPIRRYRVIRRAVPALSTSSGLVAMNEGLPRRDSKKLIGIIFLAVLLALIFFSKTIYGYNLPLVTAVKPENGRLSKLERSSGVADWQEVENIYSSLGAKVEEVFVKEGDNVSTGQELYRLGFDREEAERKLRELQNSRSRLQNEIQNINLRLEKQYRYIADLNAEVYEEEYVSTYELDALAIDIRKAREEMRDIQERYENGDIDELEYNKARYNLQALYLRQDDLERKLDEQEQKAKDSVAEKEKSRESKLKDYEADITSIKLELQTKNIELSNISLQEEPYLKSLEDYETYTIITAPIDGVVVSLDAKKGEAIRADQLIASVGAAGAYTVECDISLDNNFVLTGDVVELSNSSHTVKATVIKITPTTQNKTVTLTLESDDITAGETFEVTFQKDSTTTYTLVPNGALCQDNDGYFLNQIKRRDGMLGKEYYLERLDVYIGDSDSQNTVILQGITFFEPIVQLNNKPIESGDIVALSNESDFFEK